MVTAVVVGSGPNGLAAAITLAHAGVDVTVLDAADRPGGGMRSAEVTVPGLVHDLCSAVHPMAQASPFFNALNLERHGLRWKHAEIELAHPLANGSAAFLWRDLERTVDSLGTDGLAWRLLLEPNVQAASEVFTTIMNPLTRVPRHPWVAAKFGTRAVMSAKLLMHSFRGESARALFAGIAAHSFQPLTRPATGGMGLALAVAAHAFGWPVAEGGSQAITDALVAELREQGGRIECGSRVTTLPDADVVLLDTAPDDALAIAGDRVHSRSRRALGNWTYGPAAFKLDLAVTGGVPWRHPDVGRAGTVHVGGRMSQIADAEHQVAEGTMPEQPVVLVGQQDVADPSRASGDTHPLWVYGHVPHRWHGDASEAILDHIEQYAPGFRERIVGMHVRGPAELEAENPNYRGGDISAGATSPMQLAFRPRPGPNPYAIGKRLYLCSAATAPGPGVHGMCGFNAARAALRELKLPNVL